jgi:antitoxin component YwqK of YwqJK toxin-antitoxin module
MKRKSFAFFTALAVAAVTSCSNPEPKPEETKPTGTEKVLETFPGGQVKNVVIVREGTENDVLYQTIFYEDGKVHMQGGLDSGKRVGSWETFHKDGKPWSLNTYTNGNFDGPYKAWYESGQIRIDGNYSMGKRVGVWNYYAEDGTVTRTENLPAASTPTTKK